MKINLLENSVLLSASDIKKFVRCEFAALREVDAELGRAVARFSDMTPVLQRAVELGRGHEARQLAAYKQSGSVAEISDASKADSAGKFAAQSETLAAVKAGAEVIFQGTFYRPDFCKVAVPGGNGEITFGFIGFVDFLQRQADGAYQVQDTKLAREAQVSALLQLALYAEQLQDLGVRVAPQVALLLGDGVKSEHDLTDVMPLFVRQRQRVFDLIAERFAAAEPVSFDTSELLLCLECPACENEITSTGDVAAVAGLDAVQRVHLRAAGVKKLTDLAHLTDSNREIPGVEAQALQNLVAQARVQQQSLHAGRLSFAKRPGSYAVALLPEPHTQDVYLTGGYDPFIYDSGVVAGGSFAHIFKQISQLQRE
ncbi:MAG: hypothetical protein Q4C71_00955, partial [Microbacteriaceae bacterium]|nr:hypothetical protein [Microbacteriaceae bacterium]